MLRPQRDKSLGLFWDIILSMVIFYLHTPVLTFLIKHSVCSKIHLLSSSHGFIPLKSNFFCFCFKYLLRFRFTMTTSLNHSEFYIFKMNWLQICKWKLVFIICHSQTNGNIIHRKSEKEWIGQTNWDLNFRKLNRGGS